MTSASLVQKQSDWSAWDKASGVTVHNEEPSLATFLRGQGLSDPHFVNRLDRETSGLVLVAHSPAAAARWQSIWNASSTRKFYWAIHRKPRSFDPSPRSWREPLTDVAEGFRNPQGVAHQRVECRTDLRVVAETPHLFLSWIELFTGRQHQIRKHAALHDVELIGDTRYGERKYQDKLRAHLPHLRLGLHAARIEWDGGSIETEIPAFFRELFPNAQIPI